MRAAATYLRDFSYPGEHIHEIVEKAQQDAYREGFAAATHQMLETAERTMERVQKLTDDARTTADHG